MNFLDVAIVAVTVTAISGGRRVGLVTGATSWVLLLQSLVIATGLLPQVLRLFDDAHPAVRLAVASLFFVSVGVSGQLIGRLLGSAYRRALVPADYSRADRVAGAVGGPLAVLLVVWLIVLPPMSEAAGWPARTVRDSLLARAMNDVLPEPPDASQALRRLAGPAGMPPVLSFLDPAFDTGPPPTSTNLSPETVRRVSASTVQVVGQACSVEREGSGFTVAPELVVTNAHVVAGQRRTFVLRPDGVRLRAVVVRFDGQRDVALLSVDGLDQDPLPLGAARPGDEGAVFGHPGGQKPLEISPVAIRQRLDAIGEDLYYRRRIRRDVFVLAGDLRPGDSGGPLVTSDGAVAGVAFAIAPDQRSTAYALTTQELQPVLDADRSGVADTGSCLY